MTQPAATKKVKIVRAATGSGKTSYAAAASFAAPFATDPLAPPSAYRLPVDHTDWRPHQKDTLDWLTESGGTHAIAICKTLNLLEHQYGAEYSFDYLKGRKNYPCAHSLNAGMQANECLYGMKMNACEYASTCRYLRKKHIARDSRRAAYTYAYFLVARGPREKLAELGLASYLYGDECHEVPKTVIEFAGNTITKENKKHFGLPPFPKLRGQSLHPLMADTAKDVVGPAKTWLAKSLAILKVAVDAANHDLTNERDPGPVSEKTLARVKYAENICGKVERTFMAIITEPDNWYIRSGPNTRTVKKRGGGTRSEPAFIAKPLTASNHYARYFEHGQQTVLMSATIGGIEEYTKELGLAPDEYDFRVVPNQFTPEQRPIYILDTPAMGARKPAETDCTYSARFDAQADAIASAIHDCPREWSGLLLVTSKRAAIDLARRLSNRDLADRVWLQPGSGDQSSPTSEQVAAWNEARRQKSNRLAISWSLGVGYNGLDEKILVACKAPFPRFGSPGSYEAAWRLHSRRRYAWQAACELSQWLGRTRRGRLGDYDTPTQKNGFVAIADSSWSQLKRYMSQDILDSITKL